MSESYRPHNAAAPMAMFEEQHAARIQELESKGDGAGVVEYLLDVAPLIHDFYTGDSADSVPRPGKDSKPVRRPRKRRDLNAVEKSGSVSAFADVKNTHKEGALFRAYQQKFEGKGVEVRCVHEETIQNEWLCDNCSHKDGMLVDTRESMLVCQNCGSCRPYLEGGPANLTYEQEMALTINSNSPYVRMNHLNEILAQVQGKETTPVPDSLLTALKVEFKKDGVTHARQVTPDAVLAYLQKLEASQWVSIPL